MKDRRNHSSRQSVMLVLVLCAASQLACSVSDVTPITPTTDSGTGGDAGSAGAGGTGQGGQGGGAGASGAVNDAGLTVQGWIGTLGVPPASTSQYRVVDDGFEYTGAMCAGTLCVVGGIVP